MQPDLLRGSVVYMKGSASSPHIDTEGLPGKGLSKNPLTEIPREEQGIGPITT
jgi:hypothetical protein